MTVITAENMARQLLAESAEKIARKLEELARTVREEAQELNHVGNPGIPTYASVVSTIQHTISWGVTNMAVERLTTIAVVADVESALRVERA